MLAGASAEEDCSLWLRRVADADTLAVVDVTVRSKMVAACKRMHAKARKLNKCNSLSGSVPRKVTTPCFVYESSSNCYDL